MTPTVRFLHKSPPARTTGRLVHFTPTGRRPGASRLRRRLFCRSIVFSVFLFALTAASGKSIKMVTSWFNPMYKGQKFHKILVIGVAQDLKVRADFEDEMAAQIVRPGIETIPGNQILLRPDPAAKPDFDYLRAQIGSNHIDAVVVSRLLKVDKKSDLTSQARRTLPRFPTTTLFTATWGRCIPLFTIRGTRGKTRR